MFDVWGIVLLVVLLGFFAILARKSWQKNHLLYRWIMFPVSIVISLSLLFLLCAALLGYWHLNKTYDNPVAPIVVELTDENIARGSRFEPICSGCHATEVGLPMTGKDFLGEDAPPIGNFYAPNLTPVHLSKWTDGEIIRAIREGIHQNGRSLLIMPSVAFRNLSDSDVQAIVAYLRYLPSEGVDTEPNQLNVIGAILSNIVPIFQAQPPITEPIISPPNQPTAAYGAYLSTFSCQFCHGKDLLGDQEFEAPSLAHVSILWDEQAFIDFMRTGTRSDGTQIDGEKMPWKDMSLFFSEDDELRAVYKHLKTLVK